ncbi:ankyrin repeat domain-containing protein [Actinomadura sp. 21ATH]|uniref:ankyrin repeat domain-containing protein n=1 Tax=Actinomadura sp. 21ATH TaxID=1735444 RepID=UPI0035BF6079
MSSEWPAWNDLAGIRAHLDAGADPDALVHGWRPPLDFAAEYGTPEVVAELAGRVTDVDAVNEGRTALWTAVSEGRPDNARALMEAGADPWRPLIAGWSPARLSLAGPHPDLFPPRAELSAAESAAVAEAPRLIEALAPGRDGGFSLACVAGITAAEAARRLEASPAEGPEEDDEFDDLDDLLVGATDVPGGCVIVQPWGYAAQTPGVTKALSSGTVCYAMYANPKSGNQGQIVRDGTIEGWDLHPGGGVPRPDATPEEVLLTYLYKHEAPAYCYAYTSLRPTDSRSLTGPPDQWLQLPTRDHWT